MWRSKLNSSLTATESNTEFTGTPCTARDYRHCPESWLPLTEFSFQEADACCNPCHQLLHLHLQMSLLYGPVIRLEQAFTPRLQIIFCDKFCDPVRDKSVIFIFDIHSSGLRNIIPNYSQQDAIFLGLFIFTDGLHVSSGSSAHHQEHITVHTASGIVNQYCNTGWQ